MNVTQTLARFVIEHDGLAIPDGVRHEAARSILNWMGCAVGGSRHETLENALAALAPFSGPPEATVLGRADRLDIMHAALMNGISSHTFDFDDTHLKTVIHPSGPVASAILALAERQRVSGRDFLHAFILGVEVECRIGNSVYPEHYDIGWHITGTTGDNTGVSNMSNGNASNGNRSNRNSRNSNRGNRNSGNMNASNGNMSGNMNSGNTGTGNTGNGNPNMNR